jgi:hypothetical protein
MKVDFPAPVIPTIKTVDTSYFFMFFSGLSKGRRYNLSPSGLVLRYFAYLIGLFCFI